MSARRWIARRKRQRFSGIWPIDESALRKPVNWPGWPDGRQFAVVLTHDVEGGVGHSRCQALAEMEMSLGFRSSFNLVPEGGYMVSASLRDWLTARGFEVGVHDLHHDGKLFRSRREFELSAERINRYLRDWHADGFRAGFMLHNLDWLHCLDIAYDASTFDTDPFEPQPEAAGTIFPFWVPSPAFAKQGPADARVGTRTGSTGVSNYPVRGEHGFVELPYTLPQDSTLYLVMRESSPDIWIRKAAWLADHGGMILINTHPDYMCMKGLPTERDYPVEHYLQLLRFIRQRYAGRYWHPLPCELAEWIRQQQPAPVPGAAAHASLPPPKPPPVELVGAARRARRTNGAEPDWIDDDSLAAWDRFVADHPSGNPAHTSAWKAVLEACFPHIRGRIAALRTAGGEFRAGMAIYEVRSRILGDRLVSVPFASLAEPVVSAPEQLAALERFAAAQLAPANIDRLEVRLLHPPRASPPDGSVVVSKFKQHTIDLRTGEGALYQNLSRSCVRAWIQKAERSDVVTGVAGSAPVEWDEFYACYRATRHRLGLPCMARRFFDALRTYLPPEDLVLHLAQQDGRVLAAGLSLVFRGTWLLEWVGDSALGRGVGASQALYWRAIRDAIHRGCHAFSFGRTAASNEGLRAYKRHWGAVESDLPVLVAGPAAVGINGNGSIDLWHRFVQPVMVRSPDPVYRTFSRICYQHLG